MWGAVNNHQFELRTNFTATFLQILIGEHGIKYSALIHLPNHLQHICRGLGEDNKIKISNSLITLSRYVSHSNSRYAYVVRYRIFQIRKQSRPGKPLSVNKLMSSLQCLLFVD